MHRCKLKPKTRYDRRRIIARAKQGELTLCAVQGIRRPQLRSRLCA